MDAPGTLHHVVGQGIKERKIFKNEGDKKDLLSCGAHLCQAGFWMVYRNARCLFCELAVGRMGYAAAEVAPFLGATTLAMVRMAHSQSHPEMEKYL